MSGNFSVISLFSGGFVREWACIGNSVPPLMMRAVADHVNNSIIQEN